MAYHWYVLQSKVHKERVLWERLHAKGYEVFFPCLMVQRKQSDGSRKRATKTGSSRRSAVKIKPIFPGYLFVRLDLDRVPISSFQWMPDAVGLVDFDDKPTWVPDYFIEAIQSHLEKVAPNQIGEGFVVVLDGIDLPSGQVTKTICDSRLTGKERVNALYRLLREEDARPGGTSLAP